INFLAVVDLMPDALENFAKKGAVAEGPVHQTAHVTQAHVALLQFCVRQDANSPSAGVAVSLKCEIDFLNAVTLGCCAERGLGSIGRATEQNAIFSLHDSSGAEQYTRMYNPNHVGNRTTSASTLEGIRSRTVCENERQSPCHGILCRMSHA